MGGRVDAVAPTGKDAAIREAVRMPEGIKA
jgi:hypothetical protein